MNEQRHGVGGGLYLGASNFTLSMTKLEKARAAWLGAGCAVCAAACVACKKAYARCMAAAGCRCHGAAAHAHVRARPCARLRTHACARAPLRTSARLNTLLLLLPVPCHRTLLITAAGSTLQLTSAKAGSWRCCRWGSIQGLGETERVAAGGPAGTASGMPHVAVLRGLSQMPDDGQQEPELGRLGYVSPLQIENNKARMGPAAFW